MTTRSRSSSSRIRTGRISMMRAPECRSLVKMPDCEPVKLIASCPRSDKAIASSAIEIRSPLEISMSSSRLGGDWVTLRDRAMSWSVVLPIADTTTTTRLPCWTVSETRRATSFRRSGSATELPPYFCTTIGLSAVLGGGPRESSSQAGRGTDVEPGSCADDLVIARHFRQRTEPDQLSPHGQVGKTFGRRREKWLTEPVKTR